MEKVLIIAGATGTGKTKLSLAIAKKYQTDIINGDALQVYRGMDILTAKLPIERRQNIKHHMMDILNINETFSVADYQKQVRSLINELINQKKLPIIVGGSGLYLDSVIYDYDFTTEQKKQDDSIYQDLTNEQLHQVLCSYDQEAGQKIHMNNRKRVIRAIELSQNNHLIKTFNNTLIYDALIIFLNDERTILYDSLNKRVDEMINEGLIDEVNKLRKLNPSKTASAAIGFKELIPYFNNECILIEAVDNIKKNTRHFAKRQLTWYRHKNIKEVMIDRNNFNNTIKLVDEIINEWLNK